jgi:CubicO group peptidase (beta-lactamase class C family)
VTDGLSPAGLEGLRAAAERHVGPDGVPGLVALVARGPHVHVETHGHLALGGPPVARDTIFRIASTTKPITAAATLALAAEGRLALDEPVDALLPELAARRVLSRMDGPLDETVPAARPITTRDLLTFTYGFGIVTEMFTAPAPWPVLAAARELSVSPIGASDPALERHADTWIANLGELPLLAQPGERWLYNTPASVLGVLASRAAGQPFPDVLRTRLFEPLGMADTGFWTPHTDRLATAYRSSPAGLLAGDGPTGAYSRPPAFPDGAAGLVSTVDDLLAFARMLLAGGASVLPFDAVRAMTTDQLTPAQKAHGGLGPDFFAGRSWGFGQAVADTGAFGWDGGLGTSWLVDPVGDLIVIVLTQRMFETSALPPVHQAIRDAAYAALD